MSLNTLKADELKKVAGYFVKDVVAANPEKPSKKELLAALASEDGQGPVTWEDYQNLYLPNVPTAQPEEPKKIEKKIPSPDDEEDATEKILVKYRGKNPRWDVIGLTFIPRHPYQPVTLEQAEWLCKNQPERFSLALPSEVTDYYN